MEPKTPQEIDNAFREEIPLGTLVRIILKENLLSESNPGNEIRIREASCKIPLQDIEAIHREYSGKGRVGEESLEFSGRMRFETKDGREVYLTTDQIIDYQVLDDGSEPAGLSRD